MSDVFADLIGQEEAVETLRRACARRELGFMAGNRDFLVGSALLGEYGITALDDPTVLVAFAALASMPVNSSAGRVTNVPPPAIEFITPAQNAAGKSRRASATVMGCRRWDVGCSEAAEERASQARSTATGPLVPSEKVRSQHRTASPGWNCQTSPSGTVPVKR